MTPLFHAIALETTKPVAQRRLHDPASYAHRLGEFHFFDCDATHDIATDLGNTFATRGYTSPRLMFLPAPCTAIEFGRQADGSRFGFLLEEVGEFAVCRVALSGKDGVTIAGSSFKLPLNEASATVYVGDDVSKHLRSRYVSAASLIIGSLALINTPRVIGRKQHMPHAGLQKRLAASRGMVGKFPLHGWTEIVLEVTPPKMAGDTVHEARLTGERCLHFCRAHLRIRNGGLEIVKSHWRGDPALGMKRTRYRLAA